MDKLKIKLTIGAAEKAFEQLEQAIDSHDYRAIGAALYNLKRELYTLRTAIDENQPKNKKQSKQGLA